MKMQLLLEVFPEKFTQQVGLGNYIRSKHTWHEVTPLIQSHFEAMHHRLKGDGGVYAGLEGDWTGQHVVALGDSVCFANLDELKFLRLRITMGDPENTEQHTQQHRVYGRFYGYPECCIDMFENVFERLQHEGPSILNTMHARSKGYPCRICENHAGVSVEDFTRFVKQHRKGLLGVDEEQTAEHVVCDKLKFISLFHSALLDVPNIATPEILSQGR